MSDLVVHPSHYADFKYECWNVYSSVLKCKKYTPEIGATISNSIKYSWRMDSKSGDYGKNQNQKNIEDMRKTNQYIDKTIENVGDRKFEPSHYDGEYNINEVLDSVLSSKSYSDEIKDCMRNVLFCLFMAGDENYPLVETLLIAKENSSKVIELLSE